MKTSGNYVEEFIFEHRNKEYGAYFLRKTYNKSLLLAMSIGTAIFLLGVSVPVISNYLNKGKIISENESVSVTLTNAPQKKAVEIIPELPSVEKKKTVAFRAPVVVTTDEDITEELSDIMESSGNANPVDTSAAVFIEVPEENTKINIIDEGEALEIHTFVEEWPAFPGGDTARIMYLNENLKYPKIAKETGIQGAVYVSFVVEKDGSITNVKILRGIGGGCDEEALRVINAMPKWNPGRQNGKEVRVQFNMPITFKLI